MTYRVEIVLVVICVLLTGTLYVSSIKTQNEVAAGEFRRLTDDGVQVLRTRIASYLQSIRGAAAFVSASDNVTSKDFKAYIDSLKIAEELPSISGIGLIEAVPDSELDAFVQTMRREEDPDYTVHHLSDADEHFLIKYMEPLAGNKEAIGLDVTFAADRKVVLERARELGIAQLTPPIQLVQDESDQHGFVLLMPILDATNGQDDPFIGWINGAFVANNLMSDLTSGQTNSYNVMVVDGTSIQAGAPIFSENGPDAELGNYVTTYSIDQFGRTWTLRFDSTPQFEQAFRSYQPLTILIAGLTLTALMVSVLRSMRQQDQSLRDIAKLRVRQIKAREEENRSIVENAVTSVILIDASERVMFANQAAQLCFGYSEEEMKGMRFSALAKPAKELKEGYNAIGKTRDGQTLELDLQRNEWVTSDREIRTTVIIRDLTAQNTAQREVKRNKTLYDLALQGAEIGVFDIDLRTGLSEVSDTWCRIMGYEPGCSSRDDTQSNFMARIHRKDLRALQKADADCIAGRTERSIAEYRMRMNDDEWRWMKSDAVVVERDENGKALRLIGTQTDVTALRRDRNALEASEHLFRQVFSNAPIGMALMGQEGEFIGVNSAFANLTGITQEELLSTSRLADLMPYEDRKTIYTAVSKLISENDASVYTAEHRIMHVKGEERWGLLNVSWSYDKNKGQNFFIAQIIDITDQKKLDLVKSEFVSTVSHELRTPLTSIKGAMGLLMAGKDSGFSSSQLRLIEIASSNADRLTSIVNDILDLEKISSGQITFQFSDLNLADVMNNAVTEMLPFASTHDSTLKLDVPDEPLFVLADQSRTKQVLANLISNACKYSTPETEVLVKAERIGEMAIVYVQNVGSGVPESFKGSIFQAFSQADSSDTRARGGTGLGLNITRQIVQRQNGQIGYESTPDKVTVFWFTIPLSNNVVDHQEIPMIEEHTEPTHKLAVLHVEDDHDFAEVVSGALTDVAVVTHAKSIATAKRAISEGPLDTIILDWSLPDGDAASLLDDITKLQPDARIIGLSADGERAHDPRVYATMVKSRTKLDAIVESINKSPKL